MWNATDGTNNLPVKIEKICTFGRMKRFRPISSVVAALRDSKFLEVTGPEGLEEVKRRVAYDPTIPRSKTESRSIYAKGFGDEEPSSQFDIEAFFAPYGPTNSVRLRRTDEKLFKGSVFVEFQDDATCEAFLALDPKPLWKGKHTLKIIPKKQYQDEKEQEIKDGKIQPGPSYGRGRGRGRGGNRGGNRGRNDRDRNGRDRGDRDPDDWKRRREDDRASGFKDDRNRRDNKGGRGRGRREDRGPRNNDRNREREEREEKNGYEIRNSPFTPLTNTTSVMIRRIKPTPGLKVLPTSPRSRARSEHVRMMERRKPLQRRSTPSPRLLPSHDTLFALHFSFSLSHDFTCIVRGCTSHLALAWVSSQTSFAFLNLRLALGLL